MENTPGPLRTSYGFDKERTAAQLAYILTCIQSVKVNKRCKLIHDLLNAYRTARIATDHNFDHFPTKPYLYGIIGHLIRSTMAIYSKLWPIFMVIQSLELK